MPIKDMKAELCFDLPGGNTQNGTQIQLYWCNGSAAQDFYYDGSRKLIIHRPSGKVVDLSNNNRNNGTKIQLWDRNEGDAQKWDTITTSENNNKVWGFHLANDSGKCIDSGGKVEAGATLRIHECDSRAYSPPWHTALRANHQKFRQSMDSEWTAGARDEDAHQLGWGGRNDILNRWCEKHNYKGWKFDYHNLGSWYYAFTCKEKNGLSHTDNEKCCDAKLGGLDYINVDGVEKKCENTWSINSNECGNYFKNSICSGDRIITDQKCQTLKDKNNDIYKDLMGKYCNENNDRARSNECYNFCQEYPGICTRKSLLESCALYGLPDDKCTVNKVEQMKTDCVRLGLLHKELGQTGEQCTETSISDLQKKCKEYNLLSNCTPNTVRAEEIKRAQESAIKEGQKEGATIIAESQTQKYNEIQQILLGIAQEPDMSIYEEKEVVKPSSKLKTETQGIDNTTIIIIVVVILFIICMMSSSFGLIAII